MSDYDSPWKEALDRYLEAFLAFLFPQAHREIDWSRGHESLDKELQQVVREAELGRRLVDKLVKVWRTSGREEWVLIHIEVQSQEEADFARRMYVYHYRLFDRYDRAVVSLAVLGDERAAWRPDSFGYSNWGCSVGFQFPVVKLLDYAARESLLEASVNPFATVVLAHLKTQATRQDPGARRRWKTRLVKGLYDRGLGKEDIRQLFRLIDWLMDLPKELEDQFWQEVHQYEEEKGMPYITSVERRATEEGRAQGLEQGREQGLEQGREQGREQGLRAGLLEGLELALKLKFGAEGQLLLSDLRSLQDIAVLRAVHQAIEKAATTEEVRRIAQLGHS